ncbi:hypothetical protein D1007_15981 [Hordeum vulgare]|nr:hypothetical protein D1007_15981 [Hordeum vulgare]
MGVGKYVSSGNFNVGGYDLAIRFYPDGFSEVESAGHASAFLCCVSELSQVKDVRAKFSFIAMEEDGKVPITAFRVQERAFSAPIFYWGFMKFIEKPMLESSSDYLTIRAELFGPTKQKATQYINIEGIEPPIFEGLLHFVYTDSLPDDNKHYKEGKVARLYQLLVAADLQIGQVEGAL